MKHILPSLRMLVFMTILTGIVYPLLITILGQSFFREEANGSLIKRGDTVLGSRLVAQNFAGQSYFWPRPSSGGYNPLPSGGSNLGPTSADLKKAVEERRAKLKAAHPEEGEPPQDLLFASGSGLDPEISPAAAHYQAARVAKARGISAAQVEKVIEACTAQRQFHFLGEPRVHVLALNLALDEIQGGSH